MNRGSEIIMRLMPAILVGALTTAPTVVSAQQFEVRLRAFIANEHPSNPGFVRAVPGANGETMIPGPGVPYLLNGPLPLIGSCYNTNDRGFSSAPTASSKAETSISFSHVGGVLGAVTTNHQPGRSKRINCATGAIECDAVASAGGLTAFSPAKLGDVINFNISGEAGNPCITTPNALTPAVKWAGMFSIDTRAQTVRFVGTIAGFPSYEAYLVVDGGPPITIFTESPVPGSSAWSLLTTKVVDRTAKYQALEGEWKEVGDDFRIRFAGSNAVITSRTSGQYIQRSGTVQRVDANTYRLTYPAATRESLIAQRYVPEIIDGILAAGKVNTIDFRFVGETLTGAGRYWGFQQERNTVTGMITKVNSMNLNPPINATYTRL